MSRRRDQPPSDVRLACKDIFTGRGRHAWPPPLVVYEHWPYLWTAIQREDGIEASLDDVVAHARRLIDRIDPAR